MTNEVLIQQKILDLIEISRKCKTGNNYVSLGIISNTQADIFKELLGVEVHGYERILSLRGIRHATIGHKDLTESDFLSILLIVENPDVVGLGKKPNTIVYRKDFERFYFYVECIQNKRKRLEIKTLYKRKRKPLKRP